MASNKPLGNGTPNFHKPFLIGFIQSKSSNSLFTKGYGSSFIALLVYVDDIVITGPSFDAIQHLKNFLHSHFKLKDLGS